MWVIVGHCLPVPVTHQMNSRRIFFLPLFFVKLVCLFRKPYRYFVCLTMSAWPSFSYYFHIPFCLFFFKFFVFCCCFCCCCFKHEIPSELGVLITICHLPKWEIETSIQFNRHLFVLMFAKVYTIIIGWNCFCIHKAEHTIVSLLSHMIFLMVF